MMDRNHAMTASTSTNVYPDCSTGATTLKQKEIEMKGYQGPWSWAGRPIYSVTNMIMNGMRKKEVCEVNNTVSGNIVDVKNYLTDEVVNKALINIPVENKGTFAKLLRKFQDVFSKTDEDIGHSKTVTQKITLCDPNKITARQPYRVPHHLAVVVDAYITKLLRQGVIEPSNSPWASPLMILRKPGMSANENEKDICKVWRIVHD